MTSEAVGHFLGGAAGARDRRLSRELEGRRLDIAERTAEDQRRAEQLQRVRDQITALTEQATNMVGNIPVGRDDERFTAAVTPIRESIATLSARAAEIFPESIDAQNQLALFDSAVSSTPTIREAARSEAEANVASAQATVSAIGGTARDVEVLLGTEPVTPPQPIQPPELIRLQRERDALEAAGDTRAAQEITDIISKRGTVTGTTEFDPSPTGFEEALTTPTEADVERLRENVRTNQSSFEAASNTMRAVEEAGALSVGFAGAGVETFTGLLGNLGALGEAINSGLESVTGADLEKLTEARTSLREGVASALPEITGEKGGRFSDTERRIADETLRGLTADASIEQVISAYRTYIQILNSSDVRNVREIMRGSGINLGTRNALNDEGVESLGTLLRDMGMSEGRIVEIMEQIVR